MNDVVEFGKVLVEWGLGFITYGVVVAAVGVGLLVVGKTCFEEQTNKILAFLTDQTH